MFINHFNKKVIYVLRSGKVTHIVCDSIEKGLHYL